MVRLIERLLSEDIDAVRKQYSYVPAEDFDKIIRLDPTFDENRDSVGKYGKWLLGLYNKGNVIKQALHETNEELKQVTIDSIIDTLKKYDQYKNDRTKDIERDINRFDSVYALEQAVDNVGEATLSKKQAQRQAKKEKNYDMVFDGENYAIFVPRNHAGDMALASFGGSKKASWCTAADSESGQRYYDQYLDEGGKYYVLINKNNYNRKYQFHFESNQFMDEHDCAIDMDDFEYDNWDVVDFFESEGYDLSDYGKRVPTDPDDQIDMIEDYIAGVGLESLNVSIIFGALDADDFTDRLVEDEMDFFCEEDMSQQFYLLNGTRTSIGNNIEDPQTGERFGNFGDFEWDEYERAAELLGVDDFYDWAEDWAYDAYGGYTAEDYFRETYGDPNRVGYRELVSFARTWGLDAHGAAEYIVNELGDGYEWCESIMG